MNYYQNRIKNGHEYYWIAHSLACQHVADFGSVLDVGAGLHAGCEYLEWYKFTHKHAIDLRVPENLPVGVQFHHCDFMDFAEITYDLVLCLQVIEHIEDAEAFCKKLLKTGRTVVVSVPYKWAADSVSVHVHDPVDEDKMRDWFGKKPIESIQANRRLIQVYKGDV